MATTTPLSDADQRLAAIAGRAEEVRNEVMELIAGHKPGDVDVRDQVKELAQLVKELASPALRLPPPAPPSSSFVASDVAAAIGNLRADTKRAFDDVDALLAKFAANLGQLDKDAIDRAVRWIDVERRVDQLADRVEVLRGTIRLMTGEETNGEEVFGA